MPPLLTVGHGTLHQHAFADLLRRAGVQAVVDVRRFPGSRRHPHFARDALARWLPDAGIGYDWEEDLGGRRNRRPDSPNTALRNAAFHGYADHMLVPAFDTALGRVLGAAQACPVAVMCAESVWWRCHRRLIADTVMLARGVPVEHLLHDGSLQPHRPTEGARVANGHVLYDARGEPPLPGL